MAYKRLLICICLLGTHVVAQENQEKIVSLEEIGRAQSTIDLCIETYKNIWQRELPNDINHAYVHIRFGIPISGVLVSRGEVGDFGPRSSDYEPLFACYVAHDEEDSVLSFGKPGYRLSIGTEDVVSAVYHELYGGDAPTYEIHFQRDDAEFKYSGSQVISRKNEP